MLFGRKQKELEDKLTSYERLIAANADTISELHTRIGKKNEEFEQYDLQITELRNGKLDLTYDIQDLHKSNEFLSNEVDKLYDKLKTGIACIEVLIGRGIEWYDPLKLPYDAQVAYWNNARALLINDVLVNEKNHLEADLMKEGVIGAQDYEKLYGIRMSINGIQALIERLEGIPDPRRQESEENLFADV